MNRKCRNDPNRFCYICGMVTLPQQQSNITRFVKSSYYAYFGIKLGNQDKRFAPHICCTTCVENLRRWTKGKICSLPFGVPMVWRERKDHVTDCYFCMTNLQGINRKNKHAVKYPDIPSARKPVPHGPEVPVPAAPMDVDFLPGSDDDIDDDSGNIETYEPSTTDTNQPQPLTQCYLNDLTRDLGLSKESAELLGSRLRKSHLLARETTYLWYRHRDEEFRRFFSIHNNSLVYCNDVKGVIEALGLPYTSSEWRLFIDLSSESLKVLLHNGNKVASIPVAHSVQLKESYENMKTLLNTLQYKEHTWSICGDLKVVPLLLGMQGGYTKHPCFLCLWDSRDKNYQQREWPLRQHFQPGSYNVVATPLVNPNKILIPPLHIKLGLMKNYVKALNKEGLAFQFILLKFPHISDAKLHAGIFDGPQIRSLMKDEGFERSMTEEERKAWQSFKLVVTNFLGNCRSSDYKRLIDDLFQSYMAVGARMSIEMHFLLSHVDYFHDNCGDYSEEEGERIHQDIRTMEDRYQERWDINMMADYCWCLKRDSPTDKHK